MPKHINMRFQFYSPRRNRRQYTATLIRVRNQAACLRSHQAITLAADLLDQLNG